MIKIHNTGHNLHFSLEVGAKLKTTFICLNRDTASDLERIKNNISCITDKVRLLFFKSLDLKIVIV